MQPSLLKIDQFLDFLLQKFTRVFKKYLMTWETLLKSQEFTSRLSPCFDNLSYFDNNENSRNFADIFDMSKPNFEANFLRHQPKTNYFCEKKQKIV